MSLLDRQQAFGYTQEDLKLLMQPMAITGQEAVGSMGTDTPISALSDKPKLLYTYFKQNFAQVTNPPIDPIREELVMSLVSFIGPRPNILDLEGTSRRKRLEVRQPILTNEDLEKIRCIGHVEDRFDTKTLDITYPAEQGAAGLRRRARPAVRPRRGRGARRLQHHHPVGPAWSARTASPIPALLATAAVHNHLIRKGLAHLGRPRRRDPASRARCIISACLAGYGAEAINPYLAFETLLDMHERGELPEEVDADEVVKRYIKSIGKGMLKVMSKMGISTYQSYCGAQIFDAVGLSSRVRRPRTSSAPRRRSRASAWTRSPRRRCAAIATPSAMRRSTATRSRSAANMPTACAARTMSGRRTRSRRCSTPCAATLQDHYREFARLRERAG